MSDNTWAKESSRYYIATVTLGDTALDVYGEVIGPESDIGYTGDVEIYDVRIVAPDGQLSTSIWEMLQYSPELLNRIEEYTFERVL